MSREHIEQGNQRSLQQPSFVVMRSEYINPNPKQVGREQRVSWVSRLIESPRIDSHHRSQRQLGRTKCPDSPKCRMELSPPGFQVFCTISSSVQCKSARIDPAESSTTDRTVPCPFQSCDRYFDWDSVHDEVLHRARKLSKIYLYLIGARVRCSEDAPNGGFSISDTP